MLLYRCRMCMKVKAREINARSKHSFFITSKQIKNPQSLSRCISCVDKLVQHTWPLNDFKIFSVQIPCNLNITCLSFIVLSFSVDDLVLSLYPPVDHSNALENVCTANVFYLFNCLIHRCDGKIPRWYFQTYFGFCLLDSFHSKSFTF